METQKLLPKAIDPASAQKHPPDYQSLDQWDDSTDGDKSPDKSAGPPPSDSFSPYQRRLLAGLCLVTVLNGSLIAVMIPFFPVEAAKRGISQTVISGVFSCFAVARMVFNPLVGRLAPAIGVTRLYNLGLGLAGLSTVAFGTLSYIRDADRFIGAVFAVRVVEAAGSSAIATCGYTIAGSEFGRRVTTAIAVIGSSLTAGLAVTPAIWGGLYALGGFGTPFYTLGVIMLTVAAINSRLMPAIDRGDSRQAPFFSSLATFASSVDTWLCLAIVLVFAADVTTINSAFAVYSDSVLGVPPSLVGLFFLVATTVYALMNLVWARLSERLASPLLMMGLCLMAFSVGILLIAPSPLIPLQPYWVLTGAAMVIENLFIGGAITPCFKAMLDSGIANGLEDSLPTKAFVSSMYHITFSLGIAVGPVSGGAVFDKYGFAVMTTGIAFITAFVGVMIVLKVLISRCCKRKT